MRVKLSDHPTLNNLRATVYSHFVTDEDVADFLPTLKDQAVVDMRRLVKRVDGVEKPTPTFLVTFDRPRLPGSLKFAYLNLPVRPYFPNPLRCIKCQVYGHIARNCQSKRPAEPAPLFFPMKGVKVRNARTVGALILPMIGIAQSYIN